MQNQAERTGQAVDSAGTERTYNGDSFNAAVAQWIEYWPPKPRVVGSIPASRTRHPFLNVSEHLKTRIHKRIAGFLLPHGDSRDTIKAQSIDGVFDGTYVFHRNRYHQNKGSLWR